MRTPLLIPNPVTAKHRGHARLAVGRGRGGPELEDQGEQVAGFGAHGQHRVDGLADLVGGGGAGHSFGGLPRHAFHGGDVVVEDGEKELLLVAEVLVDGAFADAGAVGDGVDGGGFVALLSKDLGCSLEN